MYRLYKYLCTEKSDYNRFKGYTTTCVAQFGYRAGLPRGPRRHPRVIKCHEGGRFVPRKAATIDLKAVKLYVWRDLGTGRPCNAAPELYNITKEGSLYRERGTK